MNNIPTAKGKELDAIAKKLGLIRRKRWWFIKESDNSLRSRLECRVCQISNKELAVLGVKVGV